MEITPEIKEKVFAQYLGQKYVQIYSIRPDIKYTLDTSALHHDITYDVKLILKPLSAITDEDAIEVSRIENNTLDNLEYRIEWIKKRSLGQNMQAKVYQYLQSRGYDLPQFLLGGKTLKEVGLAIYE